MATEAEVREARKFVELLVAELVDRGATFVVPVDAEKKRCKDDLRNWICHMRLWCA